MLKKVLQIFYKNKLLLPLVAAVLFGIFVRFLWIDRFPVGLNRDETEVVLSAKSYWKLGTDISGVSFPRSLFANKTGGKISGLPSFLLSPFIGPFKTTLLSVRIPFVVVNLFSLLVLVSLVRFFTKDKALLLVTALVGLVNPWFFMFSRTPTEAPFALFFTLLGVYFLFRFEGYLKLFSSLSFVAAFYSYFGAKPVTLCFLPLLLLIYWFYYKKENWKIVFAYVLLFAAGISFSFFPFGGLSHGVLNLRSGKDLVFSQISEIEQQVNEQRRASITFPLKEIVYNKPIVLLNKISKGYLGWLSADFLFWGGDSQSLYRLGENGTLYLLDGLFLILGIIGVAKSAFPDKKSKQIFRLLLLGLFLSAPVGSAISIEAGETYYFRAYLLIPVFIVLVSVGIIYAVRITKGIIRKLFSVALFLSYLVFFTYFLIFFFFRFSVKQQENYSLYSRIIANYLMRAKEVTPNITVVTAAPHTDYLQYIFFSDYLDGDKIAVTPPSSTHAIGSILFTSDCGQIGNGVVMIDTRLNCKRSTNPDFEVIQDQKDAGYQFLIYNDKLCKDVQLGTYRRTHLLNDYLVEQMSNERLCNRWIFKGEK
ncbi:hypothetical protein MUP46_02945 [Patescibacteria group bacterium]|nr:hypothetical protein [Patescibacteria group bacterium]